MAHPVTVAIIEDHPVVIDGVSTWIEADPERRAVVVAAGDSIDDVLAGPGGAADVVLLDLHLGDVVATDRVAELCTAGRRVVVYSGLDDPDTILTVLEAGASAFLSKHEGRGHCVDTIIAAARDRPYVTPSVAGALLSDEKAPQLSKRERTALLLWFQSMSKASVAKRMNLSEATVRQYIDRARVKYAKSGRPAPTKTALLARAIEDGLIRADEIGEYRSHAAE
ncbi:response regulator transcription factor [Actinokineospora auranticolor]|uniref:DNA-binding NarL/FixJ family response regulator n=1 Tax=Actinokineospora auranticolor TaxID=155976 RepID=A0A2S6GI11_9PSEU|nr:response regulator transcription factor [Actinokineospora auranticolor]PPK64872.1 DNA-binding NarL/FixJ family response regulator [Actinokineospora auranticolor]